VPLGHMSMIKEGPAKWNNMKAAMCCFHAGKKKILHSFECRM